jgi:hypothetical protein
MCNRLVVLRALACGGLLGLAAQEAGAQGTTPQSAADSAKAKAADSVKAINTADSLRIARIIAIRDQVEAQSKTFRFGLSLGWRHILSGTATSFNEASINPTTLVVETDDRDQGDFVLSGIVTAFPFRNNASWLGFLANVNVASFDADNIATFNKSLEGGFGLAGRLGPDFSIGVTIERMFSRSLRQFVKIGSPLVVGTDTIKVLATDDNRFFQDDNLTALSIKFLYFLK